MTVITTPFSYQLSLELDTTLQLCTIVNTPRSLAVYLMLKHREYDQYLGLTMNADHYDDPSQFRDDALVTSILSKSPNLPIQVDRRKVAVLSWLESETQCASVNHLFRCKPETQHPKFFYGMKQLIDKVLCPLTKDRLAQIIELSGHGPGATTGVRGRSSCAVDKFDKPIHLTTNLIPFYRSIVGERWGNLQTKPKKVVRGSKVTTVPKNAKTDRVICIEPTLNVYLQRGIGHLIRSRLRVFGLDLDVQADENRKAAARAFRDELVTIDLKAASDSIAMSLVSNLVPPEWEHLIRLARSPSAKLDGDYVSLEKVSSMGNGFTFELESLIFWALARTLVPPDEHQDVHVFGDDIIIPRAYAQSLIEALNYLGFSVNRSKSFLEGNFFESCGTDWFKGVSVRPFFLKGAKPEIPYTVQIANKLRLYSTQLTGNTCDPRFRPLWIDLLRKSPRLWRKTRVPDLLGDLGFICSESELLHRRELNPEECGQEGYRILAIASRPKSKCFHRESVLLAYFARKAKLEHFTKGKLPLRGLFGKARPRWTRIHYWPSGLEWGS